MSDFGDFDPADALDTTAPDPEAVARILFDLIAARARDGRPRFDLLDLRERVLIIGAIGILLVRLREEGGI